MATSFADYKNEYIKNTMAAQKEAAAKELETAYQKNLAALDAQQRQTKQQYDASRNQAQAAYEQDLRNYDEYAAASGLNSGANAQARLAYGNKRQGNLSSLSQGEADALQTIAQNRTNTTNAYNANAASLAADYGAKEYDALYKAWQDEVARDQADRSYYYQMAMNEIQTGNTPSASVLEKAGMDAGTAASMAALYGGQRSGGSSGGSSRRSSGTSRSRSSSGGSAAADKNYYDDGAMAEGISGGMGAYARSIAQSLDNANDPNLSEKQRRDNLETATRMLTQNAVYRGKMTQAEFRYLYRKLHS